MPGGDFHPSDQAHSRAHDRRRPGGLAREGRIENGKVARSEGTLIPLQRSRNSAGHNRWVRACLAR